MVVTPKEKKVIENYLEYYHSKFKNGKQEPPFSKISFWVTEAIISIGRAERFGIPPASETISGRDATANRERISLGFI